MDRRHRQPATPLPAPSPSQAPQQQLDTRAIEVSAKALAISELTADAIGDLRSEMQAGFHNLSERNDTQHADNKSTMEAGFTALHARVSAEKDARHQSELAHARTLGALEKWFWRGLAGLCGALAIYLLVNDSPFIRRSEAPAVSIQQRIDP